MAKVLYTAEAHVEGGRSDGRARTTDGQLDVKIRPPKELGGDGGGTNPEELFAAGFAACFEGALALVGQRKKLEAGDAAIDSKVMLLPTEERGFKLGAELDVRLPSVDDDGQARELVEKAHSVCPFSNAVRGNVDVALSVNGQSLAA